MTATWLTTSCGRHEHGRHLGLDRGLQQRPLAARRLGHDEAVDAAAADPVEHDARVVVAAQLQAREHQARVAGRELFLDAGQQLREPGVLGGVDGHADAALAAEAEIASGPGPRVAERLDDVGQPGADGTAHVVAVQVPRHGTDGDTRLRGDGRDGRFLLAGWHVAHPGRATPAPSVWPVGGHIAGDQEVRSSLPVASPELLNSCPSIRAGYRTPSSNSMSS